MLEIPRGRRNSSCLACNMCIMFIAMAASTSSKWRAEGSVDEAPLIFSRPFLLALPRSNPTILVMPLLIGCGVPVADRQVWLKMARVARRVGLLNLARLALERLLGIREDHMVALRMLKEVLLEIGDSSGVRQVCPEDQERARE